MVGEGVGLAAGRWGWWELSAASARQKAGSQLSLPLCPQGKFIRIHFGPSGKLASADIDSCESRGGWERVAMGTEAWVFPLRLSIHPQVLGLPPVAGTSLHPLATAQSYPPHSHLDRSTSFCKVSQPPLLA